MVRTHAGTRNFNHVAKQQEANQVIERERKPMIVRQVSFLSLINACDVVNGKLMGFRDPKKNKQTNKKRWGPAFEGYRDVCAVHNIITSLFLSFSLFLFPLLFSVWHMIVD